MFWLPPGGRDNAVFAAYWAELADLGPEDVEPVLKRLAAVGVGGYVATPGGHRAGWGRPPCHRLWVDSLQYHRAEDVLMDYLNGRHGSDNRLPQKQIGGVRSETRKPRRRRGH